MLDGRKRKPHRVDAGPDAAWNEMVELAIAPDPTLSRAQARAVAQEYGMTRGELRLIVRRAFAFYVLRRLGVSDAQADTARGRRLVLTSNRRLEERLAP